MSTFEQEARYLKSVHDISLHGKGFIENGRRKDGAGNLIPSNLHLFANDANMVTQPNSTLPITFFQYWDPQVVKILIAPQNADEVFDIVKMGNFADDQINTKVVEYVGEVQAYSDFANDGTVNVNYNFPYRDVFRMQTTRILGDLEAEKSSQAQLQLASEQQIAGATLIKTALNKSWLFGIEGMEIFGQLNDPSLLAAVTPISVDGRVKWEDKTMDEIYNDILKLYQTLVSQANGLVNNKTPMKLSVSPTISVYLGKASIYNQSVLDLVQKYLPALEVVQLPELEDADGDQTMQLSADEIQGLKTGVNIANELFRAFPVYRRESSISQKYAAATSGALIRRPFLVARMTGM